jgi:hypothetical protein
LIPAIVGGKGGETPIAIKIRRNSLSRM